MVPRRPLIDQGEIGDEDGGAWPRAPHRAQATPDRLLSPEADGWGRAEGRTGSREYWDYRELRTIAEDRG